MPDQTPPAAPTAAALPATVRHIVLRRRPVGVPTPDCFALVETPMPVLDDGQMLVRMRVGSVDPAIRGFLDDRPSYLPPVAIDAPVTGMSLGEVVASRHADWPVGTLVRVLGTWSDHYVITPDALGLERVTPQPGVPLRAYMGALGPVGLTAWVGLVAVGQARPGDTVLVSAAAGATGSTVVQLARAMGCRVVGLAGGADKAALVQRLGADAAIDHRVAPDALATALDAAAPQGIDVYFDNVGGPLLDLVLPRMREGGRIALCGMIAQYNDADHPHGVTQLWQLVVKRLTLRGFLTYDHADRLAEAQAMLDDLHGRGQLVPLENVHRGFESLPGAFIALMQGQTTGKTLVEI
ncbi:NADPH-dependent curcumin reductase CurA [Novosphingobium capsulatum]|uniref:NADPH-dependent curcumin reductase CurA n=1 Tax=Novosphingobium capsulatum TaxID=13688 RepID=A0ABU1MLX9_9SPHN|nr:NADP-dependent oxidoreductase [Novosphingobium capsulatum]MDR6511037.1 NADPH-dependent curcumin reductase CurA [Novosphingobium capsulatum]